MSSPLQARLQQLAATFADSVLAAIREASLDELTDHGSQTRSPGRAQGFRQKLSAAPAPPAARSSAVSKPSGRLARRGPEQIAQALDRVVALVKKHKGGLRAEQIRVELGMLPKEMPRVLKDGVAAKKLTSKGQKRATTYFAK